MKQATATEAAAPPPANRSAAPRARRRWRRLLTYGTFALLLGVGAAAREFRTAFAPADADGAPVLFDVARGQSTTAVARQLEARRLIRQAWTFRLLARWRGVARKIHAGQYEISPRWQTGKVLDTLVAGRVQTHPVVLPEGFTAAEIATRLAAAELCDRDAFLALVRDPASAERFGVEGPSLEGYLFPDTYRLQRDLAPETVVRTMIDRFTQKWRALAPEAAAQGRSMRDVVTLASIVQREAGHVEEMPRVASVFLNRLARGMRLEADATTIYGIPGFDGNLRRIHLEDAGNPYNTYRIYGLTPTPISNPGAEALRAVLRPESGDYLYFVSRNDGTHVFSRTYAEHRARVNRFQRRRRRP